MSDNISRNIKALLLKFRSERYERLEKVCRTRTATWLFVVVFALLVSVVSTFSTQTIPVNLTEGMISPRDIKADRSYEIIDEEATNKFKLEATSGILPVYDMDDLVADSIAERVRLAFANARLKLGFTPESRRSSIKEKVLSEEERDVIKQLFSENLGVTPTDAQWKLLIDEKFSDAAENFMIALLNKSLARPIVAERGALDSEGVNGIVIRKPLETPNAEGQSYDEFTVKNVSDILSTLEARNEVIKLDVSTHGLRSREFSTGIRPLVQELIEPNCLPSRMETQKRRDAAASTVKNVIMKIKSGEMIIREGARYEPWHIKVLKGIKKDKMKGMYTVEFIGTFILAVLFVVLPFIVLIRYFVRIKPKRADYFLMAILCLVELLIVRFSIILAPALQNSILYNVPMQALLYAMPVAGAAMLIRMYLSAEVSMIFAVITSAFTGLVAEAGVEFMTFCLLSNFAAIFFVSRVDRRGAILEAGLATGVVGPLAVLGGMLITLTSTSSTLFRVDVLWSMAMAFVGGLGASVFAMFVAPAVESVSGYVSDIKLLELANLNHPLLRELIVRAPGTYHHSHMVGVLGEAAAEAIGANPLLVRVAAYYHDIGKMKKPQYFIENTKGESKHEKISPSMSALIVSAHVKDGVDMAMKAGIPKIIADMIPEHHGTRLMSFFFSKAKEQKDATLGEIDEKDFRYAGPKPQSSEAAILMLADATEAAVRSMKEKGSTRIQQAVQKIINDIFAESQLDECDLTLKDLNEIARAFVRIFLGIYHPRIEYPKDAFDENSNVSVVGATDEDEGDDSKPSQEVEAKPRKGK